MQSHEPHEKLLNYVIDDGAANAIAIINRKYDDPNGQISGTVLDCVRVVSPVLSLSEDEIKICRWVEILHVLDVVYDNFYAGFTASMAYNGGKCHLVWIGEKEDGPLSQAKEHRNAKETIDIINQRTTFLKSRKEAYESALGLLYDVYNKRKDGIVGKLVGSVLYGGSSWLASHNIEQSQSFTLDRSTGAELLLGSLDNYTFWYHGEKSLVTIAAPGSGKTQCHVLPALKFFEGSAVVLDIKGECYDSTAEMRKSDVFKFSPYEYQSSHHYNPLDFVSRDPMIIWNDAGVLASALIRPSGKGDDHWERRARDQLAAFICYVVLHEDVKSMESVMDCLAAGELEMEAIAEVMSNSDVGGLRRAGKAMASTLNRSPKMFEGNIETMRGHLSIWEDDRLASITRKSDWTPDQLRDNPTTVYLCVPLEAVELYASVLRVIIAQHVGELTISERHHADAQSVLMLIDEAPQLGRMEPLQKAIEVGRSFGMRTWLFAQHAAQLHAAYGRDMAEGMINSCGAVCYMNVGADRAAELSRQLGESHSLVHGQKTPLATASDLTGPKYRENIIVTAQGEYPALLDKVFFYQISEMEL